MGPTVPGTADQPLVHEVGHERGRDDGIGRRARRRRRDTAEVGIEEITPFLDHQAAGVVLSQLASDLTGRVAIHDQQAPVGRPAVSTGELELSGVEAAVAASADDHDIPEADAIG
jgi:hypothetical protein